jgi:hypothetical protein
MTRINLRYNARNLSKFNMLFWQTGSTSTKIVPVSRVCDSKKSKLKIGQSAEKALPGEWEPCRGNSKAPYASQTRNWGQCTCLVTDLVRYCNMISAVPEPLPVGSYGPCVCRSPVADEPSRCKLDELHCKVCAIWNRGRKTPRASFRRKPRITSNAEHLGTGSPLRKARQRVARWRISVSANRIPPSGQAQGHASPGYALSPRHSS